MDDETNVEETGGISRRDALKKGAVGAGVVGVVWAAPAITGLSMAPSYAAAGSLSHVACTGAATFNVPLPCPPPGHSSQDAAPGGNCGIQGIATDTHFADAHPHDANKSIADSFDKVHVNDANGQFLLLSIKRNTGNTHCTFNGATFDGTNGFFFNPTTLKKFNGAFQNADKVVVGFASDPNERTDLGRAACQGTAHVTLTCT